MHPLRRRLAVLWFFVALPFRLLLHSRAVRAETCGPELDARS